MKLTVLSRQGSLTAFAGGIDFRQDRLDGPPHTTMSHWGWHDAGVRVTGDHAQRVLDTFVTRWQEAATLSAATYDIRVRAASRSTRHPPWRYPPRRSALPARPVRIPARRSSAPSRMSRKPIRSRSPMMCRGPSGQAGGVHEVRRTLLTALAAAQRYIYVEDQAFDATSTLFPALVTACQRGVRVIAVVPGSDDPNDTAGGLFNQALSSAVTSGVLAHLTPAEQQNLAVWRSTGSPCTASSS